MAGRKGARRIDRDVFREAWQKEALDAFFKIACEEADLRDVLEYLIQHRQAMRDVEVRRLEAEVDGLIEKLRDAKRRQILEELQCFRDVLALHKRLLRENGAQS